MVYEVNLLRRPPLTMLQGSHPTWKTWNFVIYFSRPGKRLECAQNMGKKWNFNSKPRKTT